jgi:hypothetical protein
MKVLTVIAIYIASFISVFMMLSFVGFIFGYNYLQVLHNDGWQVLYTVLIGWWIAIFPAREYYVKHESYFNNVTK